jgi:hypothetical protein
VRHRYVVLFSFGALFVLLSSQLRGDVAVQERIKDVDACGLVMGPDGRGISEATVTAISDGKTLAIATSLSDGSFSFTQSINSPVELHVKAKGFAEASATVERMRGAGLKKCGHPVYAVLAVGGGNGYLTTKKKSLPKTK